uniref:Palmitoyltransferase n=1 Tax=Acrobeloides nanus TaxID=290746 RepID=A0A914CCQ6_9BILA
MFLWSYYKTVMTPVGSPPQSFFLTSEVKEDLSLAQNDKEFKAILDRFVRQTGIPVHNRNFDGSIRFCLKCSCVKPDRAHHCSVCGQCVLKFDHHCPWVNSCVNFSNYKFFLLFLGYGLVLCLFAFFTTMPYFIEIWSNNGLHKDFGRVHVLFIFFVSGMFALSLGCLFFYHLYLTAVNRSTVESIRPPTFLHGPDKNGYNLGFRRNYREIFGKNKILRFIPVFTSLGDGLQYPQNYCNDHTLATHTQFAGADQIVPTGHDATSYRGMVTV